MLVKIKNFEGLNMNIEENLMSFGLSKSMNNFVCKGGALSLLPAPSDVTPYAENAIQIDKAFYLYSENNYADVLVLSRGELYYLWMSLEGTIWRKVEDEFIDGDTIRYVNYVKNNGHKIIFVDGQKPRMCGYDEDMRYVELVGILSAPNASYIQLHKERIFLAGDPEHPSRVTYSNAYDPTDFTMEQNKAGYIDVGMPDGEPITGLLSAMGQLYVFKKSNIWRIMGDTPSEYYVEPYISDSGTSQTGSICGNHAFGMYVNDDGMLYFMDGLRSTKMEQVQMEIGESSSVIHDGKYYVNMGENTYMFDPQKGILERYTLPIKEFINPRYLDYLSEDSMYTMLNAQDLWDMPPQAHWASPLADMGIPGERKAIRQISFTARGNGQIKVIAQNEHKLVEKLVDVENKKSVYVRFNVIGKLLGIGFENVSCTALDISDVQIDIEE